MNGFVELAPQTEKNFQNLWHSIKELSKAQKTTDQRVNELTHVQKEKTWN